MFKNHSEKYLVNSRNYWWNQDFIELIIKRLDLKSIKIISDFGCGNGYSTRIILPFLKNIKEINFIDNEITYLSKIENNISDLLPYKAKINLINCDIANNPTPLENKHSDLSFCQTFLIHMRNPEKIVREMKRTTKKNGWVVAMEPNNLVNYVVDDNIEKLNPDLMLLNYEIELRMEIGKKELGQGYDSFGDYLIKVFHQCGLNDIKVWLNDKAKTLAPPYNTLEKKLMINDLINDTKPEVLEHDYSEQLNLYLSGGGTKIKFDEFWKNRIKKLSETIQLVEKNEYYHTGGGLFYIIAGKV